MLCWKVEKDVPVDITKYKDPGRELEGCILNAQCSSGMQRHLQRHHPEVGIVQRDANESGQGGNPAEHGQDKAHEQITSDFVHDVVLLDLVAFRASDKKGFKNFARKWYKKKVGAGTWFGNM